MGANTLAVTGCQKECSLMRVDLLNNSLGFKRFQKGHEPQVTSAGNIGHITYRLLRMDVP